jgi:hypothetical protein
MFQFIRSYQGMSILASLICLLLSYFAVQSSGQLPEIWPSRCLMAQKEWKQLQISKQMAEQSDLQAKSKIQVSTINQTPLASDLIESYGLIELEHALYLPQLKYKEIKIAYQDDLLKQVELTSEDGFKWIFEQTKWNAQMFILQLNELLGKKLIDDEWLKQEKIDSAYSIELKNLKEIENFSCVAKESQIELLSLYQSFQNKASGVDQQLKHADLLIKQSTFASFRQKSLMYPPLKPGIDFSVLFFAKVDHPYLSSKLKMIDASQIVEYPLAKALTQLIKSLQSPQISTESKQQLVFAFANAFQMTHAFKQNVSHQ